MKLLTITKRFEFDYGHRVLGHEGKCKHLHGHRGVAEVTVEAPELDSLGRIVDFGMLKIAVGSWIDLHWDHNILLHENDPLLNMPIDLARSVFNGRTPYVMRGNPTAENMVKELFDKVAEILVSPLSVTHVRLYETPTSWADVE